MRRLITSLILLIAIFVFPLGQVQAHGGQPIVVAAMSLQECGLILWLTGPYHDAHGNEYNDPCLAKAEGVPVVWYGAAD